MSSASSYYFARASECGREADRAELDNVKERFLRSQAAWLAMAERMALQEVRAAERTGARAEERAEELAAEEMAAEELAATAESVA